MGLLKFLSDLFSKSSSDDVPSIIAEFNREPPVVEGHSTKVSKKRRSTIEVAWERSMPRYLAGWKQSDVKELRALVKEYVLSGKRDEVLSPVVNKRFNVTKESADLIALQEIRIYSSKLKQIRYMESGVKQYTWRCVKGSPNYPVRQMHKALDGKIFSWDDPPIVNEEGDRLHPGEDEGCRCIAIPLVKF